MVLFLESIAKVKLVVKSVRQTDDDLSQQPGGVPGPKLGANTLTKSAAASGLWIIVGAAVLAGLFVVSRYNYLLFHSLIELFSVAVAWGVFLLVWNGRRFIQNEGLLFLGIAYLFIGSIDLVHTLGYKGMGVFQVENASNLAIQLWVSARGLETVSLLLFPVFLTRKIRFLAIFLSYSIVTGLLILGIFAWNVFPDCYVDGVGLTEFKIVSEYVICVVLLGAAGLLFRRQDHLDVGVFRLMIFSIFCTIIAEFFFTRYSNVYGLSNLIGHLFKLASFYLIYQALIHSGLVRPYTLLFQDLKNSEQKLRESTDLLNEAQQIAEIGSFVWDMQTDTLHFSESMTNITGADETFFQGSFTRAIQTLVHPDDQEYLLAEIDKMIAQKRMWPTKFRIRQPNGVIRHVESSSRFSFDENDAPVTVIGVLHDVTAQKETEEEREITIQLLSTINSPNNTHELMQSVTSLLHEWSGCDAIGIRLREGEDFPYFETRGFPREFVLAENQLCQYTPEGNVLRDHCGNPVLECMCGNILCGRFNPELPFFTKEGSFWSNCTTDLLASTSEADRQARTRNRCNGEGYESVALIPLRCSGETFGLLQLNDKRRNRFTEKKINLLEHLAFSLSIALAQRITAAKLRRSEELHRALINSISDAIFITDKQGAFTFVCPNINQTFGYTQSEVEAMTNINCLLGENLFDPEELKKHGELPNIEWNITGKCGEQRKLIITVKNVSIGKGSVLYACRDITERKQAQELLLQNQAEMRALLDANYESMALIQPDGRILECNSTFASRIGQIRADIIDRNVYELIPQELVQSRARMVRKTLETKQSVRFEDQRNDRYLFHSLSPVLDEKGQVRAVAIFAVDITEQKQMEKTLRESEEKYRGLYDNAPLAYQSLDENGCFLDVNPAWTKTLGCSREEALGKCFAEFLPDHQKACFEKNFSRFKQTGVAQNEEYKLKHKDGHFLDISVNGMVGYHADGSYHQSYCVFQDITERKRLKESLRQEHERTKNYLDIVGVILIVLDASGKVTLINRKGCQIIDAPDNEIVGRSWFDNFIPEQDRQRTKAGFRQLMDGQVEFAEYFENNILTSKNEERLIAWHNTLLKDDNGNITGTLSSGDDITEQKRAEHALREATLQQTEAVKAGNVGLWDWDLRTNEVHYTTEWKNQIGYEDHEIGDNYLEWESRLHPDDREATVEKVQRAIDQKKKEHRAEFRFCHKDGTYRWILAQASVLTDDSGKPVRMLGSHVDITERKRTEEQLQEAHRRLKALWGIASLVNAEVKTISDHILKTLTQMTNSQYGFYGMLNKDESVMTIYSWSGAAMKDCALVNKPLRYNISEAGIWAKAIRDREPLILNDYAAPHAEKKGLPSGHVSLSRLLVVPIFDKDKIISVAAVANRKKPYDQSDVVQITAFLENIQAIVDKKEAELALVESEQRFRTLVESSPMSILMLRQGKYIYGNPASIRFLGFDNPQDIVGTDALDMIASEYRDLICQRMKMIQKGEENPPLELQFTRKDGSRVWSLSASVSVQMDGQRTAIIVGQDITEQKQAQLVLAQKHAELKAIYDHSPVMMCILDRQRQIIYANHALLEFFGISRGDIADGRACGVFGCIYALDAPRGCGFGPRCKECTLRLAMENTLTTGQNFADIEYQTVLDNGTRKKEVTLLGATALISTSGHCQLLLCLQDITERKQAEQNLQQYTELLSSIREAQSLLIARRDKREIFDSLLNTLISLTDSEIGFLDEVLTDENGQLYKKSLAISNISWDEPSKRLHEQLQARELKFTNLKNLAGYPALTGELVIANDVSHDSRSGGLPPGHPSLTSYMGIPMYLGDRIVGVAGIANRKKGYTKQLATFLQPFVSTCVSIIEAIRYTEDKEEYQLRLKTLVTELTQAEERERKRIADLLHDSVGQSLSFAKVKLDVMAKEEPSSRDTQTLIELSYTLKNLIQKTRDLSFELSSLILHTQGLEAAIQEYLTDEIRVKYGIDTHFECDDSPKLLRDDLSVLLYRSTRELLVNIVKHAQAHHVTVQIQSVEGCIEVQVRDDGIGFHEDEIRKGKGFGLISIRERLEFLGGFLKIQSQFGQGTRIIIRVPLENTPPKQEDIL